MTTERKFNKKQAISLPHWSLKADKKQNRALIVTSWAPCTEKQSENYSVKHQAHFRKFKQFKAQWYQYNDDGTEFYFADEQGMVYKASRSRHYQSTGSKHELAYEDPRAEISKSVCPAFSTTNV